MAISHFSTFFVNFINFSVINLNSQCNDVIHALNRRPNPIVLYNNRDKQKETEKKQMNFTNNLFSGGEIMLKLADDPASINKLIPAERLFDVDTISQYMR